MKRLVYVVLVLLTLTVFFVLAGFVFEIGSYVLQNGLNGLFERVWCGSLGCNR